MFDRLFLSPVYYRDNYIIVIVIFLIVQYQCKKFGATTKHVFHLYILYLKWIL